MRTILVVTVALVLCSGCSAVPADEVQGPLVATPEFVINASGEGDAQGVWGGIPLTARFAWRGTGQIRFRSQPPYVVFDGNAEFIVEPLPPQAAQAQEDVAAGRVLIRRAGVPGHLNPPGSISSARAQEAGPGAEREEPADPLGTPPALNR